MDAERKQQVRAAIATLLAKALAAIVKLVKTKLVPKANERYCKYLQKGADKIIERSNKVVDDLEEAKSTKKRIKLLYGLKLMAETMSTIGEALTTASTHIIESVDFTEIDAPEEDEAKTVIEELDKLANSDVDVDTNSGCGPDGCEIA